MDRESLADLTIFLEVVREGSFTQAAKRLGLSQSALSQIVRRLEARLGLQLLVRTTRSLATTEAGQRLLDVFQPAMEQVDDRLRELTQLREQPAGSIRISTPEHVAETILWPAADKVVRENPDIKIEIHVDNTMVDIVADRFDAGVRIGNTVEKDFVAVPIGPKMRMAAFASPDYVARHGCPATPHELVAHRCINLRFTNESSLYAWEFAEGDHEFRVKVDGGVTLNKYRLVIQAALAGHGIGFLLEPAVRPLIETGELIHLLGDWCPPFDGYYLYFAQNRKSSPALRVLVNALRYPQ